ncbi:hypothetical protein ACFVT2_31990 [Streptomyces sp. NPDC058000]|uniref:hypothetical protein n=1 Tax=Streptomyces sp. NPDC058000 TaxID=3346299 RepID=UPI0036E5D07A
MPGGHGDIADGSVGAVQEGGAGLPDDLAVPKAQLTAARDYARQKAEELVAGRVWFDEEGRRLEFPPLGDPTRAHIVSYSVVAEVLDRAL